jgi:hypothetical protein
MSLDVTAIENEIRTWAINASGRDVVWQKFDGAQPDTPFVSLDTTVVDKNHEDNVGNDLDINNEITITGHRTIVVNVLVLGSSDDESISAMKVAQKMESSLSKPSNQIFFRDSNIAIVDTTAPRDISFLYGGTAWEKRSTFDITFGVSFDEKDDVGYFDTIEITGEAKNNANEKIKDINIVVP